MIQAVIKCIQINIVFAKNQNIQNDILKHLSRDLKSAPKPNNPITSNVNLRHKDCISNARPDCANSSIFCEKIRTWIFKVLLEVTVAIFEVQIEIRVADWMEQTLVGINASLYAILLHFERELNLQQYH